MDLPSEIAEIVARYAKLDAWLVVYTEKNGSMYMRYIYGTNKDDAINRLFKYRHSENYEWIRDMFDTRIMNFSEDIPQSIINLLLHVDNGADIAFNNKSYFKTIIEGGVTRIQIHELP